MAIRVLALCGFTQNATIYSKQLGAIRKTCKNAEFVFLEPPIVVQKCDMPWSNSSLEEYGSNATTEAEQQTAETTPRAWWLSDSDRKVYRRFDETVAYVHDFMLNNGPFDGVIGFSQGACMAAMLAALVEKPGELHPNWPETPVIPKLKFVIAVGGFRPAAEDPDTEPYFPLPKHLPVLHVLGRTDVVVSNERSLTLVEACENSRVEYHTGGHFTPSKASWRHFFNAYINAMVNGEDQNDLPPVASYAPSGTSTPNTASATPRASTPAADDTKKPLPPPPHM